MRKINFISTKSIFYISIIVIVLTVLGVWFGGIGNHNSIYENSILSTTILSISFFLFISIGLYNGFKLRHDFEKLTEKTKPISSFEFSGLGDGLGEVIGGSSEGGLAGIILGIILWLAVSILIILFVSLLGPFLWSSIIAFFAMLYWIFFRALRLVFKNSIKCNGKLGVSLFYGILYTVGYNFWIYGIIYGVHYLTPLI